jgi:hypothetical protein
MLTTTTVIIIILLAIVVVVVMITHHLTLDFWEIKFHYFLIYSIFSLMTRIMSLKS